MRAAAKEMVSILKDINLFTLKLLMLYHVVEDERRFEMLKYYNVFCYKTFCFDTNYVDANK